MWGPRSSWLARAGPKAAVLAGRGPCRDQASSQRGVGCGSISHFRSQHLQRRGPSQSSGSPLTPFLSQINSEGIPEKVQGNSRGSNLPLSLQNWVRKIRRKKRENLWIQLKATSCGSAPQDRSPPHATCSLSSWASPISGPALLSCN